ncbi:IS4 family transposase [uncultured Mucilaginibacter sp.]|uniref:IS4 family transposase n=1 Tax=uncultured Mucilaginibacter sp. TaxID=797541 RepID=UPI0025E0E452|nr:IS4 family transposase [uncultured Mucilaginibacter sp.]
MLKGTTFSGQPVFAQLTGMISRSSFETLVTQKQADYYCKRCKSWEHLMCMLYCIMNNCTSLREVTHGIAAYGDKLIHLGINYTPPRSTLSDANANRSEEFFGAVYDKLYKRYKEVLSDSQLDKQLLKRIYLIDSTTISLFKAIMKCVGRKPIDGKSKGGIKVHTMLNAYEQVPQLIHFTDAATHDHTFLSKLDLKPHQIAVFDRAYVDYKQYAKWTGEQVHFVTRLKDNAVYDGLEEAEIPDNIPAGYLKDEKIQISYKGEDQKEQLLFLRRVVYYDDEKKRLFQFLTNIFDMTVEEIGQLYKLRWQIELLFKQLKQNFPLKYFLGDNENAIKIQIWCTLIANLLFTVIKKGIKEKISFSNLVSFARQHLFSYHKLTELIGRSEKEWRKKYQEKPVVQPTIFDG